MIFRSLSVGKVGGAPVMVLRRSGSSGAICRRGAGGGDGESAGLRGRFRAPLGMGPNSWPAGRGGGADSLG